MPSFSQIKQLSVLGLAAAVLGVTASSASANDVRLWACHGPQGQAIDAGLDGDAQQDADLGTYGSGCSSDITDGGIRLQFSRDTPRAPVSDPAQGSNAFVTFRVFGAPITAVQVDRKTEGFGTANQAGSLFTDLDGVNTHLETLTTDQSGTFTYTPVTPRDGSLTLTLRCDVNPKCAGTTAHADISRVALTVSDTTKPGNFAVGSNSPVDKSMVLTPSASDAGVGLDKAELRVDGALVATALYGNNGNCTELSPDDATIDRPLDPTRCPQGPASTTLTYNTSGLPEGLHRRTITVYDAAGNSADAMDETFSVFHPKPGSSTATLNIGTSGPTVLPGADGAGSAGSGSSGGVLGSSSTSCRSPKLSMFLSQKPLRTSNGVAVLKRNKRYRFNGRLTCVINGSRKSAPKRTRVDVLSTVGKKTSEKAGTTVRAGGMLTIILAYTSSRTLTFRFTNTDGARSQVKIKIKVAKK
jgi:hypothetical protein